MLIINCLLAKVLHLGRGNPRSESRWEKKLTENSPVEKDLGILMHKKLDMSQKCTLGTLKANCPALHQKRGGQQGEGTYFVPQLCPYEDSSGVLCSTLRPAAQEGCEAVGVGPEEGHENSQRSEAPLL